MDLNLIKLFHISRNSKRVSTMLVYFCPPMTRRSVNIFSTILVANIRFEARISSLRYCFNSNVLQDVKDKVKPKKKFGFKNRKQKTVVKVPDVSDLSLTSSAGGSGDNKKLTYKDDNSCSLHDVSDQILVMDRSHVRAKDVTVSGMNNSRLEIQGSPSTLHLANINK